MSSLRWLVPFLLFLAQSAHAAAPVRCWEYRLGNPPAVDGGSVYTHCPCAQPRPETPPECLECTPSVDGGSGAVCLKYATNTGDTSRGCSAAGAGLPALGGLLSLALLACGRRRRSLRAPPGG